MDPHLQNDRQHTAELPLFDAQVLDILRGRWTLKVVMRLGEHPKLRFKQLKILMPEISQKMLAFTLRQLERDGLVIRKAYATVPVKVEYSLSKLGATFYTKLISLQVWAETSRNEILTARWAYDNRHLLEPDDGETLERNP